MKSSSRSIFLIFVVIILACLLAWFVFQNRSIKNESQGLKQELRLAEQHISVAKGSRDSLLNVIRESGPQKPKQGPLLSEPETPTATQFTSDAGSSSIPEDRFFTTTRMDGLNPGEKVAQFSVGQEVYIYAGIYAPGKETVQLKWYGPDGNHILPSIYKNVSENTGPIGFRLFTYKVFRKPGDYKVLLLNGAGKVIGETSFVVQ